MKVTSLNNVTSKEDIQIQTGVHRIGFDFHTTADFSGEGKVTIRLRHISAAGGTTTIFDRMDLGLLLEFGSLREGYFVQTNDGNNVTYVRGSVVVAPDGVLDLKGGYLSLDVYSNTVITDMLIYALDGPTISPIYQRLNPTSVHGITRELDLTGVRELIIPAGLTESLQLHYANRSPEYTDNELRMITQVTNDIVSVDNKTGTARFGYINFYALNVESCISARLVPSTADQKYIYLVQRQSL